MGRGPLIVRVVRSIVLYGAMADNAGAAAHGRSSFDKARGDSVRRRCRYRPARRDLEAPRMRRADGHRMLGFGIFRWMPP
jgi:hypothetical protein